MIAGGVLALSLLTAVSAVATERFITFDEGNETARDSNHVATIVAGPDVIAGTRSALPHNHYSLLRTVQDAWAPAAGRELLSQHAG